MTYIDRITIDPNICHGKACSRGMRWSVEVLLDLLASGMSTSGISSDHSELEREDLEAWLEYRQLSDKTS